MPSKPNIVDLLIGLCISEHYARRYCKFIDACATHNETTTHEYIERHHILPRAKSFWPEYGNLKQHPWNGVDLSARQHVIAHWILARALGGGMNNALWIMANGISAKRSARFKLNSRMYEEAKILKVRTIKSTPVSAETRLKLSLFQKSRVRAPLSDETKAKMSAAKIGKKKSDETRARMSKASEGKPGTRNGATHTDEAKAKISEASKARRVICPHCNKEGHIGAMTRHHLDNCKFK